VAFSVFPLRSRIVLLFKILTARTRVTMMVSICHCTFIYIQVNETVMPPLFYTRVELVYSVTKGTEYFVSLYMSVVINEECGVTVNSEELIPQNI
jgi:hypothetical protein